MEPPSSPRRACTTLTTSTAATPAAASPPSFGSLLFTSPVPLEPTEMTLNHVRQLGIDDADGLQESDLQFRLNSIGDHIRGFGRSVLGGVRIRNLTLETYKNENGETVQDCATYKNIKEWAGKGVSTRWGFLEPDLGAVATVNATSTHAAQSLMLWTGELKPKGRGDKLWTTGITQAFAYALQAAEVFNTPVAFNVYGATAARIYVQDIKTRRVYMEVSKAHLDALREDFPDLVVPLDKLVAVHPGTTYPVHDFSVDASQFVPIWGTMAKLVNSIVDVPIAYPLPALPTAPECVAELADTVTVTAANPSLLEVVADLRPDLVPARDEAWLRGMTESDVPSRTTGSYVPGTSGTSAGSYVPPGRRSATPDANAVATPAVDAVAAPAANAVATPAPSNSTRSSSPLTSLSSSDRSACRPPGGSNKRTPPDGPGSGSSRPTKRPRHHQEAAQTTSTTTTAAPSSSRARGGRRHALSIDTDEGPPDEGDCLRTDDDVRSLAAALKVTVLPVLSHEMDAIIEKGVKSLAPSPPSPPTAGAPSDPDRVAMPPPPAPHAEPTTRRPTTPGHAGNSTPRRVPSATSLPSTPPGWPWPSRATVGDTNRKPNCAVLARVKEGHSMIETIVE